MSFILDALRKSEHDRQRQTGPGLAEIPVAPQKPKHNVWATAAIVLLIVNLIGVGVLLLRRSNHEAGTTPETAAAAPPATAAPAPAMPAPPAANAAATPQASVTRTLPQPTLQSTPAPSAAPAGRNPLEAEVSGGGPDIDATVAARAASVPDGPPAVTQTPAYGSTQRGSVRYEAIPEAAVSRAIAAESRANPPAPPPTQPVLPSADEMAASGLPPLHLDLHVYSSRPQERFIFVNSRKYREGDAMQEGPTVEQITQAGAVLNFRGSRFLLSRD